MKYFLVFAAVVTVIAGASTGHSSIDNLIEKIKKAKVPSFESSSSSEEELKDLASDIKAQINHYADELGKKICPKLGENDVSGKMKEVFTCLKTASETEIICTMHQSKLETCMKPMIDMFEGCVEAKFHDLPQLMMKIAKDTMEYVCEAKGKYLLEFWNPCLIKNHEEVGKCFKSLKEKAKSMDKVTNVKSEFCTEMKNAKQCYLDAMKKSCKHEVTQKAFTDMFEATITKPCSA